LGYAYSPRNDFLSTIKRRAGAYMETEQINIVTVVDAFLMRWSTVTLYQVKDTLACLIGAEQKSTEAHSVNF
jgi:hypothetical protein